jgi:hypothetical protein
VRTGRPAVPYEVLYLRRDLTTKTLTLLVLSYTLDGLRSWGITRVALSSYLVLLHWTVCGPRSYLYRFLPHTSTKTYDLNYPSNRSLLPLRKHYDLVDLLNRFTFNSIPTLLLLRLRLRLRLLTYLYILPTYLSSYLFYIEFYEPYIHTR